MKYVVEVKGVEKKYKNETVLKNVSVSFASGLIHGIVGLNGSGKTLLLKLICGLIKPDQGVILVDGKVLGKEIEVPESIGAIIETPGFLPYQSGIKNLLYLASLSEKATKEQVISAMRTVGLDPQSRKFVGKYSLGMKQRLGIAQAIMENPELLILDEPFNGLDKQGLEDIRELIKQLRDKGKTILLATHNHQDIQELCDTVCEMDAGTLTQIRGFDNLPAEQID